MKIIGFDYPCMDMNILCPHIPEEEELVVLEDLSLMGGGKVANAIIAAARLGARTAFIGAVGNDRYGKLCFEDFKEHGVDTSSLEVKAGRTPLCVSIVDSKNRGKHYIESAGTIPALEKADIPYEVLQDGDYLMLYQIDETAKAMAMYVHEHGGKVVVDGDEFDEGIQQNLKYIDILIMSSYYYDSVFDDEDYKKNLTKLSEMGPEIVIVTLGSKGCAGVASGEYFYCNPYTVEVCDTTGAGDVFHGAFVYGLSEGMTAPEAASFAGAVSAIKCTVLGGRTGIPTREGVDYFRKTGKIPDCDFAAREKKYRNAAWD